MAWITITQAHVENYVVAALVSAINEAALGDSQTDRFTTVQADVTSEIRMAVASDSKNVLDTDATKIPQSLRSSAAWLIAGYMAQGLGIILTDQQANELSNARERILAVSRGDLTVEKPDTADETPDGQKGQGVSMVTPQDRVFTVSTMKGL
jgi:hypothetical protein